MSDERCRPLLLGHRGARGVRSIRENTIASFDRALADGCDGFEFDVRVTADGKPVVWHDPESGRRSIEKASAHQLPHLVRLADVIRRYRQSAFLDIELKISGAEEIIAGLLHRFPPRQGFVVSSFLPEVIEALHREDPRIPLGLICERKRELKRWPDLPTTYVITHRKLMTPGLCAELKTAGKKVFVWTVNDAAEMRRLQQFGVDGIISDKTGLLYRTLAD